MKLDEPSTDADEAHSACHPPFFLIANSSRSCRVDNDMLHSHGYNNGVNECMISSRPQSESVSEPGEQCRITSQHLVPLPSYRPVRRSVDALRSNSRVCLGCSLFSGRADIVSFMALSSSYFCRPRQLSQCTNEGIRRVRSTNSNRKLNRVENPRCVTWKGGQRLDIRPSSSHIAICA